MQKLKLNLKARGADEILSREELKKIVGGDGSVTRGTCAAYIPSAGGDLTFDFSPGALTGSVNLNAGEMAVNKEKGFTIYRGISKESALALTQGISGAKWCCDNCDQASWY